MTDKKLSEYNIGVKKELTSVIESLLFNGFVKVVFGAEGTGLDKYVSEELTHSLLNDKKGFEIINLYYANEKIIEETIKTKRNENYRFLLLVGNIFEKAKADAFVNMVLESNNLDMICSSNVWYSKLYPERYSIIRGRIYSIYFPSTLYPDYLNKHENGNVTKFLFQNDLDEDVIDCANRYLTKNQKTLLNTILNSYEVNEPITLRNLHYKVSKISKNNYSRYQVDKDYLELKVRQIIYELGRFDIHENRLITSGPTVFPIDTRFYRAFNNQYQRIVNYDKDINKYSNAAVVSRLFYDDWKVFKAVYPRQERKENNYREYIRNSDAGFLISKENMRFLLFVEPWLNDEIMLKIERVETKLPIIVVTFDAVGGFSFKSDGITYCSLDYFLKEGLNKYVK